MNQGDSVLQEAIKEKLQELVKKRQGLLDTLQENGSTYMLHLLSDQYSAPSHFIYELLQNAEDENATYAEFQLFDDRLDFYHDGEDFDIQDIDRITTAGNSKKQNDLNAIGKFGIGFKSVFAITETPYIYSGEFKIMIRNYVIPEEVDSDQEIKDLQGKTLIRLPFNHTEFTSERAYKLISERLENLNPKTILFLRNIKEICWKVYKRSSLSGDYSLLKQDCLIREVENLSELVKKVTIRSNAKSEEYIIVVKTIDVFEKKNLKIEVAYKLSDGKIVGENNSKLFVYFPTEKDTYLSFVVQGPYRTTPNRENIPLENEENARILDETAKFVAESLDIMKQLGYLDVNFLNILPIDPEYKQTGDGKENKIYSTIYDRVKEKFLSNAPLLPTNTGGYAGVGDVLLARGKDLTEMLSEDDIQKLFSKKYWLDTNITEDKTPELRNYLIKELGIEEVDFEDFVKNLTAEFLQTKTDEWMINFYIKCLDHRSLWSTRGFSYRTPVLRNKPIIRLENNEHVAPFDSSGKPQAYLPKPYTSVIQNKYKTVKSTLVKNSKVREFLEELGLKYPDFVSEAKEFIIPKYLNQNPTKDESYYEDFGIILRAYSELSKNIRRHSDQDEMQEFTGLLSEAYFIEAVNNCTGEIRLCKPSEVYLRDRELMDYFEGFSVYFVSDELYRRFQKNNLEDFLRVLKVEDKPRLRPSKNYSGQIECEGLENIIQKIIHEKSTNKSFLLWKILLKIIRGLDDEEARDLFTIKRQPTRMLTGGLRRILGPRRLVGIGRCISLPRVGAPSRGRIRKIEQDDQDLIIEDTEFCKILKQNDWIVDKQDNFRKPTDITFSDLSDRYEKKDPKVSILKDALKFKPDIPENLPEEYKEKLKIVEDIPIEVLERMAKVYKKKKTAKQEEKRTLISPEDVPVRMQEVEPKPVERRESRKKRSYDSVRDLDANDKDLEVDSQAISLDDQDVEEMESEFDQNDKTQDLISKSELGRWGEEYVYKALREELKEEYGNGDLEEKDDGFELKIGDEKIRVEWLNKHTDTGQGFDFVIYRNNEENEEVIKYIEVKSKTGEAEYVEITGTQWNFATEKCDSGEGDKYYIYVVLNAGEKEAYIKRIQNPVKLWREGKLQAHPVRLKIPK